MSEAIFDKLAESVLTFDGKEVVKATEIALKKGIGPVEIIERGLAKGLRTVGKKYQDGELFLMHLVAAAEAAQSAMKKVLEPEIVKRKQERKPIGRVVIGTVAGDIHDIGKNIVAAFLFAAGFDVHDIGIDKTPEKFVEKAQEVNADVIAASALLSTTLPQQREIVEAVKARGLRDKVRLIFGGSPVTEEWVEEIGGDGYAATAVEAVTVVKKLLGRKE